MEANKFFTNKNHFYFKFIIYLFSYLSIYLSLFYGEDSTGGAILDYENQKNVINEFVKNFAYSFYNYDVLPYTTRHSPVLILILAILEKANVGEFFIKLIYIHVNLLLPIFFYKILKIKFKKIDNNLLFLLSIIIFLSPTFRTLIVWPDSRILGVTLFSISIFYFLKFLENKNFKFCILNIVFYVLSSYISPNFSLFSIFFIYHFFKIYGFFSNNFFKILFIHAVLSFPAIYYVFILDINFLFAKATVNLPGEDKLFVNFFNQILIIPTILFFYFIPFIFTKTLVIDLTRNFIIFSLVTIIVTFLSINFFDYRIDFTGGGIFFHISHLVLQNNLIFFFFSFISIFFILNIFFRNAENFLLLIIIFLGNPQTTIYHKYYDPLLVILIFSLLTLKFDYKKLSKLNHILVIYVYFSIFLVISNLKHLLN